MKLDKIYDFNRITTKFKGIRHTKLCGWCKTGAITFCGGAKISLFTTYSLKLFYEISRNN